MHAACRDRIRRTSPSRSAGRSPATAPTVTAVTFGNANLKAETGDDVDVLFDHYLKPFGIISVGYFYKSLQNPIVTSTYQLTNYLPPGAPAIDTGNYLATQPVNAGSAWLSGFEASYLQHYTALPGFLGGLGHVGQLQLYRLQYHRHSRPFRPSAAAARFAQRVQHQPYL